MRRSTTGLAVIAMMALAVAGCGEKAQTATAKKTDAKAWESSQNTYAAEGWKGGDQAAWEAQMRIRAQGQNEYSRSAAAVPVTAAVPAVPAVPVASASAAPTKTP